MNCVNWFDGGEGIRRHYLFKLNLHSFFRLTRNILNDSVMAIRKSEKAIDWLIVSELKERVQNILITLNIMPS